MKKREKKVKVTPTKEQLEKRKLDFLKSASKHMFMSKDSFWDKEYDEDSYFKIIPVTINGVLYYTSVSINEGKVRINKLNPTLMVSNKQGFDLFKNSIFKQWNDYKAVKQSKKVKDVFIDIEKFLEESISKGVSVDDLNAILTVKEFDL